MPSRTSGQVFPVKIKMNDLKKSNRKSAGKNVLYLAQAGIIAALYIALTYLAMAFGLDKNAIQIRFSEALCILAFFTSSAVPGLYIGCLLANILTGCAALDILIGPVATLAGALGTYFLGVVFRSKGIKWLRWLVPVPTIIANTIAVPFVVYVCYTAPSDRVLSIIPFYALTVFLGEVISAGILGMILFFAVEKKIHKIIKA